MTVPQRLYESSSDPGVTDDGSNKSIRRGDYWRNTVSGDLFYCADAAPGAAVWVALSSGLTTAELDFLDGVTAGTPAASKALVLDANSRLNGVGVIRSRDTLIASAAVLTLNSVPVSLVPAVDADTYLEFLAAYVFLDYNSVAFDFGAGEDLVVRYTNGSGAIVSNSVDSTVINGTADALVRLVPVSGDSGTPSALALVANAALVLHALVGDAASGNSALKVRTIYRYISKAALEAIA